jgi:hypothetical protein
VQPSHYERGAIDTEAPGQARRGPDAADAPDREALGV